MDRKANKSSRKTKNHPENGEGSIDESSSKRRTKNIGSLRKKKTKQKRYENIGQHKKQI
jgi:hypothetical protein